MNYMLNLHPFITLIKKGEVVAFPTETVYGLGADAWNPTAIKKIFATKGRPTDNPLIVHVSDKRQLSQFVQTIPEAVHNLTEAFWPGPLTIVLSKKPEVLDLITAGLQTVAMRMPDHPLALSFIEQTGPLVAPSANTSGKPSPTKAQHVLNDFGADFPVIDGGPTKVGLESTVVDLTSEIPTILRPGKIGKKELEAVLHAEVQYSTDSRMLVPKSPGQKYSHYQPTAKVFYMKPSDFSDNTLYLLQQTPDEYSKNIISYEGNLELMSHELYDRFRQADLEAYSRIVIAPIEQFESAFPSFYQALANRIQKAVGI